MVTTRRILPGVLGSCLILLLSLACSDPGRAADAAQPEPEVRPVATVTMRFGQGGFILGVSSGEGTLQFKGRKYFFKLGSLGVGGIGVAKTTATGEVYNLTDVNDFPGPFFQARAGYAAVEGKGVHWLENANGVVIKLHTATKGLILNLGADGLMIDMDPLQK